MYFRLPDEQHDRLRELAWAEHRTVSAQIRRLVEAFLAESEEKAAA